jgi:cytochrome c nitrite reductase small subunit
MKRIIQILTPPAQWKLPVAIVLGIFVGLGAFTFKVSNAVSYLSDSPETCVNCHIMTPEYATWNHSSHREKANCNDCHVPHDNVFRKYFFKAADGSRHATMFTLRLEPEVIQIKEAGAGVVMENCIRCHENVNHNVATKFTYEEVQHGFGKLCWDCHREVPHGRVKGLSSTPNAKTVEKENIVPAWLKNLTKK